MYFRVDGMGLEMEAWGHMKGPIYIFVLWYTNVSIITGQR